MISQLNEAKLNAPVLPFQLNGFTTTKWWKFPCGEQTKPTSRHNGYFSEYALISFFKSHKMVKHETTAQTKIQLQREEKSATCPKHTGHRHYSKGVKRKFLLSLLSISDHFFQYS